MLSHLASLGMTDFLKAVLVILLIMAVIFSNWLFRAFIAAKPEGRKTVLGEWNSDGTLWPLTTVYLFFVSLFVFTQCISSLQNSLLMADGPQ